LHSSPRGDRESRRFTGCSETFQPLRPSEVKQPHGPQELQRRDRHAPTIDRIATEPSHRVGALPREP
jgi:hypothetical protein